MDKNISPIGWYIGSYLIRFIELDARINEDSETRFKTWENTVIVKANSLDDAFHKIEVIGVEQEVPYTSASTKKEVKWEYLGITDLLPIYEEMEDGAEVMWASYHPRKLKNLKGMVKSVESFKQ